MAATAGCSATGDGTGTNSAAANSGEITVTITAPLKPADAPKLLISGEFTISGSFTATKGIKVKKVSTTLPDDSVVNFDVTGNKFSKTFKTTELFKPPPEKACGKKASLSVVASDGADNTGTALVEIDVDHCAPAAVIEKPQIPVKVDEKTPVYIGRVPIIGHISDANFKQGKVEWRVKGTDDRTLLLDLPKAGSFNLLLDRSHEPTANLEIVVSGTDLAGNATELVAPVAVLRQPSFLGNSDDNDQFPFPDPHVNTFGFPLADVAVLDVDGDGLLDAVMGGAGGVAVRLANPLPADGSPLDPAKRFQDAAAVAKNKFGLVASFQEKKLDVKRLLVTDLDGQGKAAANDLVAIGSWGGTPAVVALLRVTETDTKGVVSTGYLPVQALLLDEPPGAAELANINDDGRDDFVVGAASDNKGLAVILGTPNPVCHTAKLKDEEFLPCGSLLDQESKVVAAKLFDITTHKVLNKGLSSISSIAIADFWADPKNLDDICVGDSKRPYVTCYRNVAGNGDFAQAQDSYFMVDSTDTEKIIAVEYSQPKGNDGPDLIVASSKGLMRWLRGNHAGQFAPDLNGTGQFAGKNYVWEGGITDMRVANLGLSKSPQVVVVRGGREVSTIPLAIDDRTAEETCFHGWIMGGSVTKTLPADFDNDGVLDMMAVDSGVGGSPLGVPVWKGTNNGDFVAPRTYHLCASDGTSWGPKQINTSKVADFSGDGKPEIIAMGKASQSVHPPFKGGCVNASDGKPIPFKVWPLHLWMNTTGAPEIKPRAAEFSPSAPAWLAKSGSMSDCTSGTVESFGSPVAMAVGTLDADDNLDMAVVRDEADYFVGLPKPPEKCANCQVFTSLHEFDNDYGSENSDPTTGSGLCCRNFRTDDKDKMNPLKGFGNGAPVKRASLFVYLHGSDKNKPFQLETKDTTMVPMIMGAAYGQAAGLSPVDVAIADFTGDNKNDIAVAMPSNGNAKDLNFLESRVRVFKGDGTAKTFLHADFTGDKRNWLNDQGYFYQKTPVEYRVLNGDPRALGVAAYGPSHKPGLFVVQPAANKVTPLMTASGKDGPLKAVLGDGVVVGDAVQACGELDFNGDLASDILCASTNAVGFCAADPSGDGAGFVAKVNLVESATQMADAEIADVNQDKNPDLVLLSKDGSAIDLWLGDGTGGFAHYNGSLRVLQDVKQLHAADLEKDGCADLVVRSNYGLTTLRNLGCDKK